MEEKYFKILQFLSKEKRPVTQDDFPEEIQSEYLKMTINPGSLLHELEIVLDTQKKWITGTNFSPPTYTITDSGKVALRNHKSEKLAALSDDQIKHSILGFLKTSQNKFFLNNIKEQYPIDEDKLIYILDEMKSEGNIEMKDISTKQAIDYLIAIHPKGVGTYIKSEYLKDKPERVER